MSYRELGWESISGCLQQQTWGGANALDIGLAGWWHWPPQPCQPPSPPPPLRSVKLLQEAAFASTSICRCCFLEQPGMAPKGEWSFRAAAGHSKKRFRLLLLGATRCVPKGCRPLLGGGRGPSEPHEAAGAEPAGGYTHTPCITPGWLRICAGYMPSKAAKSNDWSGGKWTIHWRQGLHPRDLMNSLSSTTKTRRGLSSTWQPTVPWSWWVTSHTPRYTTYQAVFETSLCNVDAPLILFSFICHLTIV